MIPRGASYASVAVKKLPSLLCALALLVSSTAASQTRVLRVAYTPTKRAQVAIWLERADGSFVLTIHLTEGVGLRGIGNRPGALQMNSGFRWPYGRREGVLPIWAHRRAAAPGAERFPMVIFQDRTSEGFASRTSEDSTVDNYFCLSFNTSAALDVDATSCASVFNSDKGRFLTAADVQNGYAEPHGVSAATNVPRALPIESLYPPRRDLPTTLGPFDHPDVANFNTRARAVMPDIDAVTRATAPADTAQLVSYLLPSDLPEGDYVVWVEVNTERDHNTTYSQAAYPTPNNPAWDSWAIQFGYAYRGQPSVAYRVPFTLDELGGVYTTQTAQGYGSVEGQDGMLRPLDATITDDPATRPGSGVDRLRANLSGNRVSVSLDALAACAAPPAVPAVPGFTASVVTDEKHSHEWADLRFTAIGIGIDEPIGYQVKVSTQPITTELEFVQAEDAKATTLEYQGLDLCPIDTDSGLPDCPAMGSSVAVQIGKLNFQTRYYVAVRALGPCGTVGPISTAEFETTEINFTTVAPCFVATAAHGSAMASDVETLRAFRNQVLMASAPGRAFVRAYYALGPRLASVIASSDALRAVTRAVLRPFVSAADLVVDSERE